ncbi:MAG: PEP-utilizing enzyme [Burkholderiaceae bacterium]
MTTLAFDAPDSGVWEQDGAHSPRPATRFLQEAFGDGFVKGFQGGTACYGLMLDHLEPFYINGFLYHKAVIVGAPKNAKGPPPKIVFKLMCLLHPAIRRRLKTAATVLQEKPWRGHLNHWDTVLKPESTRTHLALQAKDIAALSDTELADHILECFENYKRMAFVHHIYTMSCAVPVGDFMACTQQWSGLPPSEIAQALRGSSPISSGVTDEYLAALRAIAGDDDAIRILAQPGPPDDILQRLRGLNNPTGQAIRAYLDLVSHRVMGGYDISCLTAIETPQVLVHALQWKYTADHEANATELVLLQTAKIRNAVPAQHRALFDELLAEARLINRLRDERGYWSDLWASGLARRAMREAGRRLLAQGKVHQAEHLLDATCAEARTLLTGGGEAPPPDAQELQQRHQFRVSVSDSVAPTCLNGPAAPPPPAEWFPQKAQRVVRATDVFMAHLFAAGTEKSDAKTIRGISVSSGVYQGRARVIENIDDLNLIQKGEVLVTRSTSAAFNYALPLVGAIVTDRGGIMSHAAIVAREFGLPGVVGCKVACESIPDGAMVRVDADNAQVTILS